MMTEYSVCQLNYMSQPELQLIAEKTADAFKDDISAWRVFPDKASFIKVFKANFVYHMETGFVFAAYDRDNVCQGIALWEDFRTSRSFLSFLC